MTEREHPAKKIKFLLRQYSLGVRELAEKVGITLDAMHEILDEKEWPTANLLYRIAALFSLQESYFADCIRPGSQAIPKEAGGPAAGQPAAAAKAPAAPAPERQVVPRAAAPRQEPAERSARRLGARHARKLDLAEMAARQSALIDLLIDKKVFSRDELLTRLEILRARVMERKMTEKTR